MSSTRRRRSSGDPAIIEAVARALWDDDEARDQRSVLSQGCKAPDVTPWEKAHELDQAEFREKAVVALRAVDDWSASEGNTGSRGA